MWTSHTSAPRRIAPTRYMIQECFFTCDSKLRSDRLRGLSAGWHGGESGGTGRVQPLPLLSAVELADYPRYIHPGLAIRGHSVILVHRCRTGVISRQRQCQMIVIPQQQRIQIGRAAIDVLICDGSCRSRLIAPRFRASTASSPARRCGSPRGYCRRSPPAPRWPADRRPDCGGPGPGDQLVHIGVGKPGC